MTTQEIHAFVKKLTPCELDTLKEAVKNEMAARGRSFKPGDTARISNLYGGAFLVEVKELRGTKFHVILKEELIESRSMRTRIGSLWIVPPSSL